MGIQNSWRRGHSQNCGIRIGEHVRKSMPTTLGVTYLVVLLNVFISTGTELASTEMKGYIQCSKKVSDYALKKWFPENEGTNIFVVKGGFHVRILP